MPELFSPETIARHSAMLTIVGDAFVALDGPMIRNPRRCIYEVQSESQRGTFRTVNWLGAQPSCNCPASVRYCRHVKATQMMWLRALEQEAIARQEARAAAEVERKNRTPEQRLAIAEQAKRDMADLGFDDWQAA